MAKKKTASAGDGPKIVNARFQKRDDGWRREEPGWYTHAKLGGIVNEVWMSELPRGWYFYPADHGAMLGPFKSLAEAKKKAGKK